jgi:hypothetical protein
VRTPWERFKQAAQLGEPEQVPVGLIVDSPWLPGYAGTCKWREIHR